MTAPTDELRENFDNTLIHCINMFGDYNMAIDAAIASVVKACAEVAEPSGERPCDCDNCYCGNPGDQRATADWDTSKFIYDAILSLSPKEN